MCCGTDSWWRRRRDFEAARCPPPYWPLWKLQSVVSLFSIKDPTFLDILIKVVHIGVRGVYVWGCSLAFVFCLHRFIFCLELHELTQSKSYSKRWLPEIQYRMSVSPRIDLLPSFAHVVNPIIQVNDDAEETRKIIFRGFRMWSSYHKPQDNWFLQMHHFLGLSCGSVLAQEGKSVQCIRASQGRSYLQPPGKVSKGASCVTVGPQSTAPPWTATPLSSLSFYHHFCQTIQVFQLDLRGLKTMWVFFFPLFL